MTSKPGSVPALGRAWRKPTYWPCGVRCTGGVNLIRAFVRNLRTWLAMPREKAQAVAPRCRKDQCASQGRTGPQYRWVGVMSGEGRGLVIRVGIELVNWQQEE